jgi:16S rRNA processing protein RimM
VNAASEPTAREAGFPADAVEVGRVVGAWGVKGWIRVRPFAKDPQALFSSRRWFLQPPDAPAAGPLSEDADARLPPLLRIVEAREHGDDVIAAVRDLNDRDSAEALRGVRVFVPRSSFPSTGDDEYYWVDLIGLQVVNRQGEALGEVTGLIDNGAHSVLRVCPDAAGDAQHGEQERLIPFVDAYIDKVDLQARRIDVDWGLDF